ncbi:Acylphosphatase [Nitrosomonas aestuarii]|uniref:acylphosphatase n=1 Tax=Nitrosomonas aestuarii TaxID=52441 RepID=A0A1I3XXJ8_9PROT|nr:acylphosphatase [Nitrosomonas aestuarii]SFK24213.1 Acylphosphatase [Nitrosomonas aestuarii]
MKRISFYVTGNVQNVMFRQTFIRGAQKRKLKGGASNDTKYSNRVHCSLEGESAAIDEMISKLRTGKPINSWNAHVEVLHFYDYFTEISEHQVTTENVNQHHWSPNVEFYL